MNWQNITGYITPESITSGSRRKWAREWLERAKDAAQNGNELVVIEVRRGELLTSELQSEGASDEPFI